MTSQLHDQAVETGQLVLKALTNAKPPPAAVERLKSCLNRVDAPSLLEFCNITEDLALSNPFVEHEHVRLRL